MSQFDEDTHIDAILAEIGTGTRKLCDIGARLDGSNSANLIRNHGFTGVLVDRDEKSCQKLATAFPHCQVIHKHVEPWDVNSLVQPDCWFFSLDIDSTDFWVWANLRHRPALVVMETVPIKGFYAASMDAKSKDHDGYGMSVDACRWLGEAKGYTYLGRNVVNAFFVRKDLPCQYRIPLPATHEGLQRGSANNVFDKNYALAH